MNNSVADREIKLKQGLVQEETKKNINDSKFRAVAQGMDYSGFRQMVLGANLKPTKAGEVFSITNQKKSIFNSACNGKPTSSKHPEAESLIVKWRRSSQEERWDLLRNTSDFQRELEKFRDFSILADIISICDESSDLELIRQIIAMLTQIAEFKGSRKLLTKSEKQRLDSILKRLEDPAMTEYF
jgi:Dynein attachment factor N-terminus